MKQIPLVNPLFDDVDKTAIENAFTQYGASQGLVTKNFENEFTEFMGTHDVIATNSCTSALFLALKTLGIHSGDKVLMPSYTCLSVLNSVLLCGCQPILVDNLFLPEQMQFNIDPVEVIKHQEGIQCIIIPHMFGVPAPLVAYQQLKIPVIEDITLSLGAKTNGKLIGLSGDFSVCSFHDSKMIAGGEGGILCVNNDKYLSRARYLSNWENEQQSVRRQKSGFHFEHRYNFRMGNLAAALASSQLRKLPFFLERRRKIANRYLYRFKDLRKIGLPVEVPEDHVFFRFMVDAGGRDVHSLITFFEDHGIELGRGVYPALHQVLGLDPRGFCNTETSINRMISVPCHPSLTDSDVDHIQITLCDAFQSIPIKTCE